MSYYVYGQGRSLPVKEHETKTAALEEAARLAGFNPGVAFHVVKVVVTFKGRVVVERLLPREEEED